MFPPRILLLEDDRELRDVLSQVLDLEGYDVVSAGDGPDAIQQALGFPFELLIFDVKLPGPDGLEVLAQFRKDNPDLPSIVITGYATEADTLRALRLGVGEYLRKPFNTDTFLEAVKRLEREVYKQRELKSGKETTVHLALWSLEFLASSVAVCQGSAQMSPTEAARMAYQAATQAGHREEACRELQASVLLRYVLENGEPDNERLKSLISHLPGTMQVLSEELRSSDRKGLAAIGGLCLEISHREEAAEELEELVGATVGDDSEQRLEQQRRHLLSLGRSLLASGDRDSARIAFQELCPGHSREAAAAHLELGRLAWAQAERDSAIAEIKAVEALIPGLGPQAAVELQLETAQLSLMIEIEKGKELLQGALPKLERLGLTSLRLQVDLVLHYLNNKQPDSELLGATLQVSDLDFLIKGLTWNLPFFLEAHKQEESPALERLLKRLMRAAPAQVKTILDRTDAAPQTLTILKLLEGLDCSYHRDKLQQLTKHTDKAVVSLATTLLQQDNETEQELRIFSLGPQEIWLGDTHLVANKWRTTRSRFMLACLAQSRRIPIAQDVLIDQFWPGCNQERGRKNLSQALTDLRKALAESGCTRADDLVLRKHERLSLCPDFPIWHDLDAFQESSKKGRAHEEREQIRQAASCYREAVLHVRGRYLEDCNMDWVQVRQHDFDRDFLDVLERLARCLSELELHPELVEIAQRLLVLDPCHQRAHMWLMQAYRAQKRPELALRQFEKAKVRLANELGLEPQTELLREYQLAKMSM